VDTGILKRAAELLRQGEVVALPTETVYGLAANALDPDAVAKIYELKGRPAFNPIIVHVCEIDMARQCVRDWPPMAQKLAESFWPGPLTVVLPRSDEIPDIVTAGGQTVGVRWPRHALVTEVIRLCGFPWRRRVLIVPVKYRLQRAVLRNAPILILDEPTSGLDAIAEEIVIRSLEAAAFSRTTLVIAHRLSTVRFADRIIVLEAGQIVEQGRHPELIARNGKYAQLCRLQFLSDRDQQAATAKVAF